MKVTQKLKQSKHIRLFHNINKTMFIISYNHYLPKISELKTKCQKFKFQI